MSQLLSIQQRIHMSKVSTFRIIFLYRKKPLIHADTVEDTYSLVSAGKVGSDTALGSPNIPPLQRHTDT